MAGDLSRVRTGAIGLSAGGCQGQPVQGYGVDSHRTDTARQGLGKWKGGTTVCSAMKFLFKKLEKLSGQVEDNVRELSDLAYIGAY